MSRKKGKGGRNSGEGLKSFLSLLGAIKKVLKERKSLKDFVNLSSLGYYSLD
jgi:hypothetical protein